MKCSICDTRGDFPIFSVKEMMIGFREEFDYFECSSCGCFQIKTIPENLAKYYPKNYYSFNSLSEESLKKNQFKTLQFNQTTRYKMSLLGFLSSIGYKNSSYEWFRQLGVKNKDCRILDIGCGDGQRLRKLYTVGFTNLTGIDPFLEEDLVYNENIRVFKKELATVKEKYDLVMMHHSLEHMPNQKEAIAKVFDILEEGGKALIRIPIMSAPLFKKYGTSLVSLDAPRHLFIHSIKSISQLVESMGFEIEHKLNDAEIYEFMASEQYQENISTSEENSYFNRSKESHFSKERVEAMKVEMAKLNRMEESSSVALFLKKPN